MKILKTLKMDFRVLKYLKTGKLRVKANFPALVSTPEQLKMRWTVPVCITLQLWFKNIDHRRAVARHVLMATG